MAGLVGNCQSYASCAINWYQEKTTTGKKQERAGNRKKLVKIFVYMLNEGTDVWRPVEAEEINGYYKILSQRDIEDEDWEFETGDIVKCIEKTFQNGKTGLIAIERLNTNESGKN